MIWKTPTELIEELQANYGVHTRQEFGDSCFLTLEFLKKAVERLENQKKHFQGMCLRVFEFLDQHYPDAPGEFDIIENGGELE
tara:strand:+ start:13672 stop:13920 length:249 start_codon:yes stop_codon:yes gene_type:complete